MNAKLNSSSTTAAVELTPGPRRLIPLFSPENRDRQVAGRPNPSRSLRLPVSTGNREQLKALRAAELAVWDAVDRRQEAQTRSLTAGVRLPAPVRNAGEGWLYALLASLCAGILGYEVLSMFQSAGNWHQFVQFVRQLLA